eukprot:Sdes_comp20889_c0_seq1m17997
MLYFSNSKLAIILLFFATFCRADEHNHVYNPKEPIIVWMNTIWPSVNQQESYEFYSLPYCRGPVREIDHYHESIGEALLGVELQFSGLDIKFLQDVPLTVYCSVELTRAKAEVFHYAILHDYKYQMYIDDLPIWAKVSDWDEERHEKKKNNGDKESLIEPFLFTSMLFEFHYNGNQIIRVDMKPGAPTLVSVGQRLDFSYSVRWIPTSVAFADRYERYFDKQYFQNQVHWFSIFNSFMMVLFLVGLVSMILMRTLRQDFARYSRGDEEFDDIERDLGDEYGWKQILGDVFRPPPHLLVLSSLYGTGLQLFVVCLLVILLSIMGDLYESRGSLLSTVIFVFAAASPVGGFSGASMYSRNNGKEWIRQMVVNALLFPGLVCSFAFTVNFIAIYYESSRAIPFGTMISIVSICTFVILPLNLVGTILGRNLFGQPDHPCRINSVPRPIPEKKWYLSPGALIFFSGILPFASIFIETHFVLTSFWKFKLYYVFGFMFLVFIMLCIVSVCVTVVSVYFLLNSEDYRWQWMSFFCASSAGLYVYLYSIYFFIFTSKMYGLFQTVFYFAYMALLCFSLATMCGAIGLFGSSLFVRKIYANVKID